ncbi:hypothetical protein [Streptomyces broussonetiae]|uniref:Uncharacterized protein n=1 Tax=Streptomyces broussonetiae TaxID=2686304 RepID=A0A6I6NB93_9ACTN|nr:hypothetical protein [Streptomyces broussonetiae]QHA08732.1 hypothetical protein GQF42_40600 [Streptomyces broussonetiae]
MARHHHKSNEQVEGNPDTGHGRGMPRRPDEPELAERTREDRREAGLPTGRREDPDASYEEAQAEVDQEVREGRMKSGDTRRKDRDPYPPSDYEG